MNKPFQKFEKQIAVELDGREKRSVEYAVYRGHLIIEGNKIAKDVIIGFENGELKYGDKRSYGIFGEIIAKPSSEGFTFATIDLAKEYLDQLLAEANQ